MTVFFLPRNGWKREGHGETLRKGRGWRQGGCGSPAHLVFHLRSTLTKSGSGGFVFLEAGAWGERNKTAGPSPTATSTRGLGMADRERVGARFGGSEMNYTLGHAAPPEAVRRFFWAVAVLTRTYPKSLGNRFEALGSLKDTPHSNSPQLAEWAHRAHRHRHTHRCSFHPLPHSSLPPTRW